MCEGIGISEVARLAQRIKTPLCDCQNQPYPYQLQFHLTDSCNLRCVFCPTNAFVPREKRERDMELSTGQWIELINQAAALGVEEFHICGGGEPFFFLDKALAVMGRIKELGKSGEIITNGTILTPEAVRRLVELGWDKMTFSLDGPSPRIHDAIRVTPCFERIVENIRAIREEQQNAGRKKPQLCVHFVVCSLNYKSVPEMIPLCKRLGVDTFLIQALNVWSEEMEQYKLSPGQEKELQAILREAQEIAEESSISTNIPDFLREDLFTKVNEMDRAMVEKASGNSLLDVPCFMPWYNLSVFADGRILPCFILRDRGVSFKEHTLTEAWESDCFDRLRGQMFANTLGKDCAKCNPWSLAKTEEIRAALRDTGGRP